MLTKRFIIGGAGLAVLLVVLFSVFNGIGQSTRGSASDQVPFGRGAKDLDDFSRPTVDYEKDHANKTEDSARRIKNARYNKYGVVKREPDAEANEVIWDSEWSSSLSDLPGDKSDLVVEGMVTDTRAFLSDDSTGVYSEFTVNVSNILKVRPDLTVNIGTPIVMERFGGKVRYRSGQVLLYRVDGQGFPMIGKKYVFFLAKAGEGNFKLLTAYEIVGNKVYALDGSRINFRGKGNWKFDKHNGEAVDSFMAKLASAVLESEKGASAP